MIYRNTFNFHIGQVETRRIGRASVGIIQSVSCVYAFTFLVVTAKYTNLCTKLPPPSAD